MRQNRWLSILCLVALFTLPATLFGQATSSGFSGLVRDSSQAVIAGASVSVANVETGITRTTTSDPQGRFRIGDLKPGTYQLTVTMPGFAREVRKDVVLQVGQELSLNFTMQIGAVEQEVVVTGEAPVVETTVSSVASNVTQEQLRELPLNGRSFVDLVTLNPSAVTPHVASRGANYGNGPQLSVAGARTDANNFMIDGTDMSSTTNNTPGSSAGVQLGVDTIREYQVITANAKAEYGRNTGAIINAVTRAGTNEWHGSAFEFLRNSALDARSFFDRTEVPPFKRNQFGATFGGPIQRDRTFFFLGFEALRQRLNQTQVWNVPTRDARLGIGILRPGEAVDPRAGPYLDLYPLPNGADLGRGVAEYIVDQAQPTTENFGSVRVDHNLSNNDFLFGRYTISRGNAQTINNLLSDQASDTSNQYVTVQLDHIFSPTLLNTFRAGFNRSLTDVKPTQVKEAPLSLGFAPGVPLGQIGSADLSVQTNNTPATGACGICIVDHVQNAFQFEDHLSSTHGPHTLKLGAMLERFQWNTDNPAFWQGSILFSDLRNFLLTDLVSTATYRLPTSSTNRGLRTVLLAFFGQDDYRITQKLTLNIGLRWEFTTQMSEVNNKIAYLRRSPLIATLDDIVVGKLWDGHIRNFQPRLGFNWAIGQDQKTSLSGGFGIFHNQILHNSFISFRAQLPFNFRAEARNFSARNTFPNIEAMVASVADFRDTRHFDFDNFKVPTFYRYNLTLQRELPGQTALRVGYVGSLARHMARRQLLNIFPQPVPQPDGSLFFPPSPAPQAINSNLGQIEWMSSDVNLTYSSLVASLQKRFTRGLMFQASYSWSKSVDDYSQSETNFVGETGANAQYGPDRTLERARSSYGVPHVFVFNAVYELPFGPGKQWLNAGGPSGVILGGWQIGGILTLQQGLPFTVGSNIVDPGFRFRANRPNLKPGVDVNKLTGGPRELYFDTSAFAAPPPGTLGNAGRNLLLGPPLYNLNFTLNKVFPLSERMRLQFRSEFFNLFNHTNFANPQARVFTSRMGVNPAAGRIVSTTTPGRQIQFALRLNF